MELEILFQKHIHQQYFLQDHYNGPITIWKSWSYEKELLRQDGFLQSPVPTNVDSSFVHHPSNSLFVFLITWSELTFGLLVARFSQPLVEGLTLAALSSLHGQLLLHCHQLVGNGCLVVLILPMYSLYFPLFLTSFSLWTNGVIELFHRWILKLVKLKVLQGLNLLSLAPYSPSSGSAHTVIIILWVYYNYYHYVGMICFCFVDAECSWCIPVESSIIILCQVPNLSKGISTPETLHKHYQGLYLKNKLEVLTLHKQWAQ